ncbi:hypothetical protein A1O1_01164 [Capronia coronata CBS 617.96]|uniref:N-acetyltransferase domain-containing protein n=1 Tax=Capronia coronata CBS 617.96 TaxID=1182541 RepID=W9YU54_9EURO|nr:uncharacterized protein A1O1_01164 [Capronia coronata CBS 617.96]EXJ96038.1 hypothetical protein A1O1_01164 [Capronia coronata CBS 617.96]
MNVPITTGANISVSSLAIGDQGSGPGSSELSTPSPSSLPKVTASQSPEHAHRLAEVTSRATLTDPLNILFQQDKTGSATPPTPNLLYKAAKGRMDTKIAAGSFIVEAGDFAAVACWEPPSATPPPLTGEQLDRLEHEKPIFGQFIRDVERIRQACLGPDQQQYWTLSLMARDPERKTKGAVRAVIQPYVARAKQEKMPIWLVAGNARARDVYAYFGFRVVDTIWSYSKEKGDGDERAEGVPSWCMVCNWPPE